MTDASSSAPAAGPSETGDKLPEIQKTVTQEQIHAYADAARDWNPIHLDEEFAAGTQFGRRIAHGMLGLGFISEMMSTAFPEAWSAGGSLKVRFKSPIFPGETVRTSGEITKVTETETGMVATCSVNCIRPDGSEAIVGTATVPMER